MYFNGKHKLTSFKVAKLKEGNHIFNLNLTRCKLKMCNSSNSGKPFAIYQIYKFRATTENSQIPNIEHQYYAAIIGVHRYIHENIRVHIHIFV